MEGPTLTEQSLNIEEAQKTLKKYLDERHGAGERAGGSGHLGFLSVENIKIVDVQHRPDGYEVAYEYDIFVETEFEHTGNTDFGKKHYSDKVSIDKKGRIE